MKGGAGISREGAQIPAWVSASRSPPGTGRPALDPGSPPLMERTPSVHHGGVAGNLALEWGTNGRQRPAQEEDAPRQGGDSTGVWTSSHISVPAPEGGGPTDHAPYAREDTPPGASPLKVCPGLPGHLENRRLGGSPPVHPGGRLYTERIPETGASMAQAAPLAPHSIWEDGVPPLGPHHLHRTRGEPPEWRHRRPPQNFHPSPGRELSPPPPPEPRALVDRPSAPEPPVRPTRREGLEVAPTATLRGPCSMRMSPGLSRNT